MTQATAKKTPHALVVDDNFDSAETLAMLIEMEGFTVATASSLRSAREQLLLRAPRIIFLDLTLPDGSGLELFEQTAGMVGTDVVVLSGLADPHASSEAARLGAMGYLVKPANMQRLNSFLDQTRGPSDV